MIILFRNMIGGIITIRTISCHKNNLDFGIATRFFWFYTCYMEDRDWWIISILGIVVAVFLFWGIIGAVRKSFQSTNPKPTIDSAKMVRDQKHKTDDLQDQQKRFMEDRAMRMRDLQRK